jgi:indolepyruvate ferredoxin oxidoreductase beta subunit
VKTTTVSGYVRVWLLTRLRPLRPISHRAHEEHARMERWLATVAACAARDTALAREVAGAAQLVKGYGDVRRRMVALVDALLESVEAALRASGSADVTKATALTARVRGLVLQGPEGEAEAWALLSARP